MPRHTRPPLPQRAQTPSTPAGPHRPRGPETTGSGPGTGYPDRPDPETLRRVATALRKLPTRQQQARAAAPRDATPGSTPEPRAASHPGETTQ